MFGGIRSCGSGNMFLVCHGISEDHVVKGSCDFIIRTPSWLVMTLPAKFGCHRDYYSGDVTLLVVVMTLPAKFGCHRDYYSGDVTLLVVEKQDFKVNSS